MRIRTLAAVILLGITSGSVLGGRTLLAQVHTKSGPAIICCTAGNVQLSSKNAAYGLDPQGKLTYNANTAISFDCGAGPTSGCAICVDSYVYKSNAANGPWTLDNVATSMSPKKNCGSAGNTTTIIDTETNMNPNLFFKLVVEAAPCLVTDPTTCAPLCDDDANDYTTMATYFFSGDGSVNQY